MPSAGSSGREAAGVQLFIKTGERGAQLSLLGGEASARIAVGGGAGEGGAGEGPRGGREGGGAGSGGWERTGGGRGVVRSALWLDMGWIRGPLVTLLNACDARASGGGAFSSEALGVGPCDERGELARVLVRGGNALGIKEEVEAALQLVALAEAGPRISPAL